MLWQRYDSLILDLDGVVYVGLEPVDSAIEVLGSISKTIPLYAATNNASRTPVEVAAHLTELGLTFSSDQVVTSAQAGANLLRTCVSPNSEIFAVGGDGVGVALREAGFKPLVATGNLDIDLSLIERVSGAMQGHGVNNSWGMWAALCALVSQGKPWVATNLDSTVPLPWGLAPGNGSFVSVVSSVTGKLPLVAGKPEPTLFQEVIRRGGLKSPLVVGDRVDTDVLGAKAAGIDSLLVLTGVTDEHLARSLPPSDRPTYVSADLGCLLQPSAPEDFY